MTGCSWLDKRAGLRNCEDADPVRIQKSGHQIFGERALVRLRQERVKPPRRPVISPMLLFRYDPAAVTPRHVPKVPIDAAELSDLEVLRLLAFGNAKEKEVAYPAFETRFLPTLRSYYLRTGVGRPDNSLSDEISTAGLGELDSAINSYFDYLCTGGREWLAMNAEPDYSIVAHDQAEGANIQDVPFSKILNCSPSRLKPFLGASFRNYILDTVDKLRPRSSYHLRYDDEPASEIDQNTSNAAELIPDDGSAFAPASDLYESLGLRSAHASAILVGVRGLRCFADASNTYPAEAADIIADFVLKVWQAEKSLEPSDKLLELTSAQRLAYWAAIEIGANTDDTERMTELTKLTVEALLDEVIAAHCKIDISEVTSKERELVQTRRRTALKGVQSILKRPEEQYRLSQEVQHSPQEDGASRSPEDAHLADYPGGYLPHPPIPNPGLA